MKVLSEDRLQSLKDEIVTGQEKLEQIAELVNASNDAFWQFDKEERELNQRLEQIALEKRKLSIQNTKEREQLSKQRHELNVFEMELAKDERERKIVDLMKEHPDFWTALENRLQKTQDELISDFPDCTNFLSPSQAIKNLKAITERERSFSQTKVFITTTKGLYENLVRQSCENKLDGVKITVQHHKERTNVLDRFIQAPDIEPMWNLG